MSSPAIGNYAQGLFMREGFLVGPFRSQGIIYIGNRHDAGRQGDGFILECFRITRTIPFLVVAIGNLPAQGQEGLDLCLGLDVHDGITSDARVALYGFELVGIQLAWLEQDGIREPHLADIMQDG